ncbi:DNA polymerase I [Sulfuricurvum sp. RIFCSPLOWO2_12_FULL_43_24]|uniref:DNA polymerase I n=1 Tax=Sulfuricurvum sp. RIFCSPLOWO2_12_FULL_43_24 TaxID=1802247 RepID=UPI0008D508B5|nr:DNA polymerase I [Sulfuricurvum sp. RIFCSPLOWO2_12_FULL_43_24]OHD85760.1 MAG: DNA polymerase I [Sulfuricurvum sp. RIFCSPLOWO2_02_FULL_43_45]OHD88407.1 MAG: DNA polymerase I [Sulfuricurvum sp. RIFCSPLOWO2_12_FULL_43_24]
MAQQVVTIIDTFGFFFRSFYALPPLKNKHGFPTGLLTGFINFIASLHKDHSSDYLIFALDAKGPSFRAEIDPNYKANRSPAPEELVMQLPIAIDWIDKMGYKSLSMSGYEADDMIASVVRAARQHGFLVRVVSHDKDLYQLIDDDRVVLVDAISKKVMNERHCDEKYGVHPRQFIDYQSLIGDTADNVPGVKGIGKVTAQKLLEQFGTLDEMYARLDEVTPPRIKGLLETYRDDAFRSRELVRLKDDVFETLDFSEFSMHFDNPFLPIYDDLVHYEMNAVLRTLKAKALFEESQSSSSPSLVVNEVKTPIPTQCESIDGCSVLIDHDADLMSIIASISEDTLVAFDTETTGLDPIKDHLVGFSFSLDGKTGYYVPMNHSYLGVGNQVTADSAKKAIKEIFTHKVIGHNIKFDLHFVTRFLEVDRLSIYADTMVLAWLTDSARSLSMDNLSQNLLNHEMIHFKDTVKKGENFASVAIEDACKYAGEDAYITYRLYDVLREQLLLKGGQEALDEAFNVEFPFTITLLGMEREGIAVDTAVLELFKKEVALEIATLTEQIHSACGTVFNLNSPKQLGVILFETLGLPHGKKTKTGYSTDEQVLEGLKNEHPVIAMLLQYREYHKLFSTYIEPLIALAQNDPASRIYTSFVQSGTATGRLSSKNPNLQNIPVKTALGMRIREAFIAPKGKKLIGIDYSQIELRLLAHFSEDTVLVNAFNEGHDIHMQTAIALFGETEAASKRNIAKTVNFGLLYGMGQKKLSDTLGITTKEAKEIIERYFETFPSVKGYFSGIVEQAKEMGYVETLLHRRRYFDFASATPMLKAAYERESVNTVFQGSASDLIKLSMNKIDTMIRTEALRARMLLQIHDELIFEVDEDMAEEYARRFVEVMESILELRVPLKTSMHIGNHWGELK